MTDIIPAVGMHRTEAHAYYWQGRGPYTSVTTALRVYDKSDALVGWAKRETAAFAVRHLDALVAHRAHNNPVPECDPCRTDQARRKPVGGSEAARMWVSSIPDYIKDEAASLGTDVHRAAEGVGGGLREDIAISAAVAHAASVGRVVDGATLLPFSRQYRRFLAERQPQFLAIEYMGLSLDHEYAGTGDIIANLLGVNTAIDIKTHTKDTPLPKTYYPDTAMQLAACSRFDFIGREGDPTEYAMPQIDAHAVLLLGRDDYRLIPYAVTDTTFDAFLSCLSLWRWRQGEAKTIVGSAA